MALLMTTAQLTVKRQPHIFPEYHNNQKIIDEQY